MKIDKNKNVTVDLSKNEKNLYKIK